MAKTRAVLDRNYRQINMLCDQRSNPARPPTHVNCRCANMTPRSIDNGYPRSKNIMDNLGIIIHLDAHAYKLAWQKLYGGPPHRAACLKLADPTNHAMVTKAYQDAKHKIMLHELYGIRGFYYLEPKPTSNQIANALQASISGIQAFYTALGQVMIPTMERMTASFEHFAQTLVDWGDQTTQAFARGMTGTSEQTRDTILAMATDPNWQPPEPGAQSHDRP